MNPIEIGQGKSFKGLARYLLHDARQEGELSRDTTERVGWVQSFNLDGASGNSAWRLMAATALSAGDLKDAAGIKRGKPAVNTVYHFAITFPASEKLTEGIERRSVEGALKALGLDEYQALAIKHTETEHPHVHVMVNLIHPENGVSAASKQPDGSPSPLSNSQRKLQTWAKRFERENGLEITEGRLANANRRAQGEKVDARRKSRPVYEREKREGRDDRLAWLKERQQATAAALTAEGRQMGDRHKEEWTGLKASYADEKRAMTKEKDSAVPRAIERIKEDHKPIWSALFMRHRSELEDFRRDEQSPFGRLWHAAAVVRDRAGEGDLVGGLVAAFSAEQRRAIVMKQHDRERAKIGMQIRTRISATIDQIRDDHAGALVQARHRFMSECEALRQRQDEARAALRDRWNQHNAERGAALQKVRGIGQSVQRDHGRNRGLEP
ncbi:MAG: relaxase/mobilization nuclease domain-containing protein [Devosia sp.]|uniref:relaxase/mobilization nuclease domain-containing protein n=1 Tax=Devosia sp. TaxID=1871048 RepID=UPI001ACC6F10|nr:relaxase/mobilization nuclease domain-containing protein [Devosia sp.]MBN9314163.1 relaxase/mobilization nuclease domain-containing protein [Devosia sp.]